MNRPLRPLRSANLKRQAEIQFAVLQLETERLVETDGGEIFFPDVQVDGHQRILFRPETHCVLVLRTHPVGSVVMQFATGKVNNMQHHSACQALFAEIGVYNYSFDVTDRFIVATSEVMLRWHH